MEGRNAQQLLGIQRGTAHQGTIYVYFCKEVCGIARFYTTAIKQRHPLRDSRLFVHPVGMVADELLGSVGKLGGGRVPCADGPHRFVSYGRVLKILQCQVKQALVQLFGQHVFGLFGIAGLLGFAYTINKVQLVADGQVHFRCQLQMCLALVGAPLRVADERALRTDRFHHFCAYLAGEGTAGLVVNVLRINADARMIGGVLHRQLQIGRRHSQHHRRPFRRQVIGQVLQVVLGSCQRFMHFPIGSE